MNTRLLLFVIVVLSNVAAVIRPATAVSEIVFEEVGGLVAVEAEHAVDQTATEKRAFYLTSPQDVPTIEPDGDPPHVPGASGGAYMEVLPDTRRTHDDRLIRETNFSPEPGKMAVLSYKVYFNTPGRYYVWVRAYSTGSEDNGLHVGIDGTWPESGQRLQWCEGKRTWRWESKQRTELEHCGEPFKIYLDVEQPGEHTIHFSMREDGFEFDKWIMTTNRDFVRPDSIGPQPRVRTGTLPKGFAFITPPPQPATEAVTELPKESPTRPVSEAPLKQPRQPNGDGQVVVSGEQRQWHKITLTLDGPFAHEQDNQPNPFTELGFSTTFTHHDGTTYVVPGYFAADGNAANTSAEFGTQWRVHFAPDRVGRWTYETSFVQGDRAALNVEAQGATKVTPYDGIKGELQVQATNKTGRDFRAHGRLRYVDQHYLQFAGSKRYFLKAGADAPETLLGYVDFDNTVAGKPDRVPLKTWGPHVADWKTGNPTWGDGKGKGLIGAINYLANKGCNAFSFLTYNAGGDGDNVWPFIDRDDKLHYDCSKLDQWGIVFDHGTQLGMYLHFKLQETENDDHLQSNQRYVPESLDGGELGDQRKLYLRELIARFGHNLALNWNVAEENTQSTAQQVAMLNYIAAVDPYHHHRVIHTFPDQQDKVYRALLGERSNLTGTSLQNSNIRDTHVQAAKWVRLSKEANRPWVVAFDESGSAAHGQCPDLGYKGFDGHDRQGKMIYTEHEVRKQTLWGTLMAGGAGVEYYFGYQFAENDLVCEDWRSRDRSWDYCRIAINFFHDYKIPFWQMSNHDEFVGNPDHNNSRYCFAKLNETYVVYLPDGGETELDLRNCNGEFTVMWFNPRTGGELQAGSVTTVSGGQAVSLGNPPAEPAQDWVIVVRRPAGNS